MNALEAAQYFELEIERDELLRCVKEHQRGHAIEANCYECSKTFWHVDDELIQCPFCEDNTV